MSNIVVTAMIVVRNEEDYIVISLKSLLNQDFPKDKYEIIIVDGCSTDNTLETVKKYIEENGLDRTLRRNGANKG